MFTLAAKLQFPYFQNLVARHCLCHFYTNEYIIISKKNLSPQLLAFENAIGSQICLRIAKIGMAFISLKLKTPCIYGDLLPKRSILDAHLFNTYFILSKKYFELHEIF